MALEPEAVVQVLLRGRLRLAMIATAVLRDAHAAEDIYQQVVLSALEHRADFRDDRHVLAWAVRAARFRAVDAARRKKLRTLTDTALDRLEARWADPDEDDPADRLRALHRCLGRLSASARDLLKLRYDDGLAVGVIAGRLGRSADAVYQTLSRVHRSLRECVGRNAELFASAPGESRP